MRLHRLIIKMVLVVVWLMTSAFAFLVCQGPDGTYILDSNYQLWKWPGAIIRLKPVYYWSDKDDESIEYVNPLKHHKHGRVNAFAVLDEFIIGKAPEKWFAINRKTHAVWYPYKSQQELESATGIVFSDLKLTTSLPWSRMVIYSSTKVTQLLIALFFGVCLIGIRRIRGLIFKYSCGVRKKQIIH